MGTTVACSVMDTISRLSPRGGSRGRHGEPVGADFVIDDRDYFATRTTRALSAASLPKKRRRCRPSRGSFGGLS